MVAIKIIKSDGHDLSWMQIDVLGTLEEKQLPFFIEWKSLDHPSTDGKAITSCFIDSSQVSF